MEHIERTTKKHSIPVSHIFLSQIDWEATDSCKIFVQLKIEWKKWDQHNQCFPTLLLVIHIIIIFALDNNDCFFLKYCPGATE